MGREYISSWAECPFYCKEDRHRIYCEGLTEGSSIHLAFRSPLELKNYRIAKCCKNYKDCRIAQMLYKKYEVEDESKRVN